MPALGTDMTPAANETDAPRTRGGAPRSASPGAICPSIRERPRHQARLGRINVKVIIILVSVVIVLGIGAFVARHVRRKILAERDFAAGNAAYDRQDWKEAARHFQEYLGRRPEDLDILRKYAESLLSTEPLEQRGIGRAISSYRQLLRHAPDDAEACEELAKLYIYLRNLGELGYIAQRRLEQDADDPKATIWQARALLVDETDEEKVDEARKMLVSLRTRLLNDDPGQHPECIEACRLLSQIELVGQARSPEAHAKAMRWLDRAVEYDPKSAETLIYRSILRRSGPAPADETLRQAIIKSSRGDLQQAQAIKTDDPRIALSLSREWMRHGQLDRAQKCLQSVRDVDPAVIKKYFIRASDWTIARFMQAGELAIRRNKPAEAQSEAEKVLQAITDHPRRIVILPTIVRLCLTSQRNDEARKHLDEFLELRNVLQVSSGQEETAFLQAMVALAEGKTEEVIAHLEPLAVRDSPPASVLDLLARTYERTGRQIPAIRTAQRYLKLWPNDSNMWLLLARQYTAARNFSEAAKAADKAKTANKPTTAPAKSPTKKNNITAELARIEANIRLAAEESTPNKASLDKLAGELAKLQQSNSKNPRVRSLGALVELALGRPDAAEQRLRQAIKDSVKSVAMELMLVRVLAAQGKTKDALDAAIATCVRHASSGQAWLTQAGLHESSGNHSEMRATLQRGLNAVKTADKQGLARGLAFFELVRGDRKAGLRSLRDLAQQDPHDVNSRSLLLNLPEVRKDTKLAEQLLEEIRKVQGEGSRTWRQHRASLWLAGDRWRSGQDKVIKALEKWMLQDPESSFPALTLARLNLRLGKARQAEEVCRKALSLNPSATETAQFLIALLGRQKRHADAAKVLEALEAPSRQVASLRLRAAMASGELEAPIRELTLRASGNPSDVSARILLASMVYQQDRDAKRALAYLDEAAEIKSDSTTIARIARLQAAILKNEGKAQQARELLDSLVKKAKKTDSFGAYQLRAAFLRDIGELEAAEKDYIHLTTLKPRGEGYRILASFYHGTNRIDDAIRTLNESLKDDSKNAGTQFRLLHLLIQRKGQGDLGRAETLLASLEKTSRKSPELLFARALLTIAQRDADSLKKARGILEKLVELEPAHVRGYLALIRIAMARQNPAEVRTIAIRGLEASPNHTQLLLSRARAEMILKNSDAAADLVRKAIRTSPANTDAIGMFAAIAIESKKPEAMSEALALARRAAAARTADYRLPLTAAAILRAMKKPADAVSELDRYAKTPAGKTSIPILLALAEISRTAGQTDDWNRWILKAETAAPKHPAVLIETLRGLAAQNKHDQLISRMAAYRQGKQVNSSVLQTGAEILLSSESPACRTEAIKLYERALDVTPESIPVRLNLALAASRTGDLDRAEAVYREILKTQPRSALALNGLAWLLATNRKNYKSALPLIDKAAELAPNNSHVHDTRGVILSNLDRLADARKDFEKCVELTAPDSARRAKALLQLGRTCSKLKDHTATRKHLKNALAIDAKNKVLTDQQRREIADILKSLTANSTP